jgi:polyisoprenoid-binding protein YceI
MSATSQTLIPTGTWNVDPSHSSVNFSVKHLGIAKVHGKFNEFEGSLTVEGDLATAKATGTVKTASVDTGESQRDEHLRTGDFFDAEKFPEITFESTKIEATGDDEFTVTGNLTLHGHTNEVTFKGEVTGTEDDPWGNKRVGLELYGSVDRGDYEMKFNQALGSGNLLVGEKVKIELNVSAVKAA